MKTLRISEDAHLKLTALLGELTAQTMRMQTYTDAIETLLAQSVLLPPELISQVETFISQRKDLGFTTREEFMRDAIRRRLSFLREEFECVEVPKEDYDRLQEAIKDMETSFLSANDFVIQQVRILLAKYDEWRREKEEYEKKHQRKR